MKRKNKRWWILVISAIFVIGILAAIFWDAIMIRVAPKAVLSSALSDVFSQLETRFQDNPLVTLVKFIDPEGKYTANVNLETSNPILGTVNYDMKVQTNGIQHQLFAEGNAGTSDKNLEFSLYLDPDFMAVSSQELVDGKYYGITYDTFSADIRSIPLLSFFVSDNILSQWDTSVQNVQEQMNRDFTIPQIPKVSEEDIQTLFLGILAMPCEIEERSISADDSFLVCKAISYTATGAQVNEFLADALYAEDAALTVTFYLHQKTLVQIRFSCISESQSDSYTLYLGMDPSVELLYLQALQNKSGIKNDTTLTLETQRGEDRYVESWNICRSSNGFSENKTLSYDWASSSGTMRVTYSDMSQSMELNLAETENGLRIETEDLRQILRLIGANKQEGSASEPVPCVMTVGRGSQITTPAYRNLNQWSLEDFWTLLSGVGSWIGIDLT